MFCRLRSSSRVDAVDLVGDGMLLGVRVGDLRFHVGDLLQLPARGIADGLVADVSQQAVGIQGRDGDLRIEDVLFGDREIERCRWRAV